MDQGAVPADKRLRLRYAGRCRVCGLPLPAGTEAIYERSSRSVRCLSHGTEELAHGPERLRVIDSGVPGASARREYDRRVARREERVRTRHPRLGGLILALGEEQQSTRAWDTGAVGEERLGKRLNELATENLRLLHDRRIPGSRANIDHLAVTATGVYVIDAKRYKGRPRLQIEGGLFRPRVEKLMVGSRNCTKVVDGVLRQADVVADLVEDQIPVYGVLCFVDADWPLIGGSFTTRGIEVLWPKRLYPRLRQSGPIERASLDRVHRILASSLPAA